MFTRGNYEETSAKLSEILCGNIEKVAEGLNELKIVYNLLVKQCDGANIDIDFMIIRGLDYYTGTVYETFLEDYREIGSISSGGRYENLASNFTEQKFPGVGGSIGLTRLFFVLKELGLIKTDAESMPVDYCVLPFGENEYEFALEVTKKLQDEGQIVDIDYSESKLGNRLNRAAKIAKNAIIIGDSEVASREVEIKNLASGEKAKRQF